MTENFSRGAIYNMHNTRSLLCPNCKKLISSSVSHCPFCHLKKPGSRLKSTILKGNFRDPEQLVLCIISVNVRLFILSILLTPNRTNFSPSPFTFLSPGNQSLLILGSTGTIPVFQLDRWWTLLAANYLHGGILHLLFNILAFRQLAPLVIQEFGLNRMIIFYTLGGITGFYISSLAGVQFTIGASAAICSLIGALLFYGKSRGGIYGRNIFSQIGSWAVAIAVFGVLVPGINNWGHGGGMAVGVLLAYVFGYQEKKKESIREKFLAVICIVATCAVLLWSCFNGLLFILFVQ